MEPDEHHSVAVLLVTCSSRVLMFDCLDVFFGEAPMAGELLPVVHLHVMTSQRPKKLSHLLAKRLAIVAFTVAITGEGALSVGRLDGHVSLDDGLLAAVGHGAD